MMEFLSKLHFAEPLWFLALIPLAALVVFQIRIHEDPRFGWSHVSMAMRARRSWRVRLQPLPRILRVAALVLLIAALARPETMEIEPRSVDGIDMMIALDLSGSMYAVDLDAAQIRAHQVRHGEEPPNRIDIAKDVLLDVVRQRSRDRIGLVLFAREAFVQSPLTLDHATLLAQIEDLEIGVIDASATAIGNAIGLSLRGLLHSDATTRTIVLITDGKQHGGNISPMDTARLAADEGIRIYTILIGREGPALVPAMRPQPGRAMRYREEVHPIDPELLENMSAMTGGQSFQETSREALERDFQLILDDLERTRVDDVVYSASRPWFAHVILFALGLLLLDWLLRWTLLRRFP